MFFEFVFLRKSQCGNVSNSEKLYPDAAEVAELIPAIPETRESAQISVIFNDFEKERKHTKLTKEHTYSKTNYKLQ